MSSSLSDEFEREVYPWLQLAEDLRLLRLDVEICVMGDQSSGKSSVLEALSGIPFPRGAGLVTRCPIRMVMRKTRPDEAWSAVVSTTREPGVTHNARDIAQLSTLINRCMQELCSSAENFSTENVVVELVSPDACDLTVVDLPGIIRTVTAGQDVKCIADVNRLIKSYLQDERTIILAVIPANQDIATIDILERAQSVDPSGERTIGVITKSDLVGAGAEDEVVEIVNNRKKPLELGYTMLKNRSQKEVRDGVSSAKAKESEQYFFSTHPVFRSLSPELYGVDQLSKKLTTLLVNKIKGLLTPMRKSVERKLNEIRANLRALPMTITPPKTSADRQKALVAVTQQYLRYLMDCIRGEYWDRVLIRHPELRMYNSVLKKFELFQAQIMGTAPQFRDPDFIDMLAVQIKQLRGRELQGFMSQQAFHMCMAQYIDMWQEPTTELVGDMHTTALNVSYKLAEVLFVQYPALRDAIKLITEKTLSIMADETSDTLNRTLAREKDPFTLNAFLPQWVNKIRFDRFNKAVDKVFDGITSTNISTVKEEAYTELREWYKLTHSISPLASALDMTEIMEAYWHLASKRYIDNCCTAADSQLLNNLPPLIQDKMYELLRDDEQLKIIFEEDESLLEKKKEMSHDRDKLLGILSKLNTIPSPTVQRFTVPVPAPAIQPTVDEAEDEELSRREEAVAASSRFEEITFKVPIGDMGVGLIIVNDPSSSSVVVKGFRSMPYKKENPSQAAGMRVGDVIKAIDDVELLDHNHAVNLIRASLFEIKICVLRIKVNP